MTSLVCEVDTRPLLLVLRLHKVALLARKEEQEKHNTCPSPFLSCFLLTLDHWTKSCWCTPPCTFHAVISRPL